MSVALRQCREFLEERYRSLLNLQSGFSERPTSDRAAWMPVSIEDLTRFKDDDVHAAVLADPEIGILLYLIEYKKDQNVVPLVVKALALRTKLLIGNRGAEDSQSHDLLGSWRVAIYWLVEGEPLFREWETAVSQLRANAPHMEEIPIDAICNRGKDWPGAFKAHRFSRLLLNTRRVLRIEDRVDVERWSAADALVDEGLEGFSGQFSDKLQSALAAGVERHLADLKAQKLSNVRTVPPVENDYYIPPVLGIRNFRNIKQATVHLGSETVSCSVITGPNGSGKSSIFEAISLATFKSSYRYRDYLRDTDAGARRTSADYVERYLTNLSKPEWGAPALQIKGEWESIGLLQTDEDPANINLVSGGCLLSQDASEKFCQRTSSELAAEVLRGYSDLANGVQWYVDDEYQKSNYERQELLRSLGLRASITKVDTAHLKIAEQQLSTAVQFSTSSLVAWLAVIAKDYPNFIPNVERSVRLWQRWDESRSHVASQCVTLLDEEMAAKAIEKWLSDFNLAISETEKTIGGPLGSLQKHIRSASQPVGELLEMWGRWLQKRDAITQDGSEELVAAARSELGNWTKQQAELAQGGSSLRARLDHLLTTKAQIEPHWRLDHDSSCPTCGSDLVQRGGFGRVLDEIIREISSARDSLDVEFRVVSAKIKESNEKLENLGVAPNPVPSEQQQLLVELLGPLVERDSTLEEVLRSAFSRERLISFVTHLRATVGLPPSLDVGPVASAVAKAIVEKCTTVSITFNAPNNWAAVRKRLTEILGDVVKSHLPDTLEALWLELVLNLTPAPWLIQFKPAFHVRTQRNSQALTIRVGAGETSPLARYIFNAAEVNVLGLAWFFVRFITYGRFVTPMMVLDDPAQDMDQTTYRDLCRLLETIGRIHRVKGRKLTMVVLFHQEDRALDAARALNATLSVLSWAESQDQESIKRIKVLGDAIALSPAAFFS
jgi:hypothetical protein